MTPSSLTVVTAIFNPGRFTRLNQNYARFLDHMARSGVQLITVECAHGEHGHAVTESDYGLDIQVRSRSAIWTKENLLNIGLRQARTPYVMWSDADIEFYSESWAMDTIAALQHYAVVQPWSEVVNTGPKGEFLSKSTSFCSQFLTGTDYPNGGGYADNYWHPGFAWAMRRSAYGQMGGLMEGAILGSADHHMALAMIGSGHKSIAQGLTQDYANMVSRFQRRADSSVKQSLGFVPGVINHAWHGRKENRLYLERNEILARHSYQPSEDILLNEYGVIELAHHVSPEFRRDCQNYFRQRNDDANTVV